MDEVAARAIIANKEDEHTERKEATNGYDSSSLYSYVAALANEGGGHLILGVSNDGVITGTLALGDVEAWKNKIFSNGSLSRRLRVAIHHVTLDDKRVVILTIPSRPRGEAISYRGSFYMRSGESLVPMNFDTLTAINEELTNDYSATIMDGISIDELDDDAINRARQLWIKKSGNADIAVMTKAEVLSGLELADERGVSFAAIILVGTTTLIQRLASNSELVWEYRKQGVDIEFVARKDFKQPFVLYFDELWHQIDARNDVAHIREGFLIRDIAAYNENVVREAVLNAVAHRDYQDPGSVYIRQSPEQLIVESPGGFVSGVTADNIIEVSRPRNRRIAEVFQKLGLVERSGQGADKIFQETIAAGKGLPDYHSSTSREVRLVVNAQIQDVDFIKYLERITTETDIKLSPKDYVLLEQVSQGLIQSMTDSPMLSKFLDAGLIEKVRSGQRVRPILSKRYYVAFNKRGEYTRQKGLEKSANLEIILQHLKLHQKGYMADIEHALPHVKRSTLNRYLRSLADNEKVELVGNPHVARGKTRAFWRLKK